MNTIIVAASCYLASISCASGSLISERIRREGITCSEMAVNFPILQTLTGTSCFRTYFLTSKIICETDNVPRYRSPQVNTAELCGHIINS